MTLMLHEMLLEADSRVVLEEEGAILASSTFTVPATLRAGDLLIIRSTGVRGSNNNPVAAALPAGWTRYLSTPFAAGTNRITASAWWKVLTAGDIGSTFSTWTTTSVQPNNQYAAYRRQGSPIQSATAVNSLIILSSSQSAVVTIPVTTSIKQSFYWGYCAFTGATSTNVTFGKAPENVSNPASNEVMFSETFNSGDPLVDNTYKLNTLAGTTIYGWRHILFNIT